MLIVKFILVFALIFSCKALEKDPKEQRTIDKFFPLLNGLLKLTKVNTKHKYKPVFEALDGIPRIIKFLLPKNNTTKVISESWPLDYIWFTDSSISRITKYLLTAVIFKKILTFMMLSALLFFIPVATTITGDNSNFHYFKHTDEEEDEEENNEERLDTRIMNLKSFSDKNGLQAHSQLDTFNNYKAEF